MGTAESTTSTQNIGTNLAQRLLDAKEVHGGSPLAWIEDIVAKVTGGSKKIRALGILSQPVSPATTQGLDTNAQVNALVPKQEAANDSQFQKAA